MKNKDSYTTEEMVEVVNAYGEIYRINRVVLGRDNSIPLGEFTQEEFRKSLSSALKVIPNKMYKKFSPSIDALLSHIRDLAPSLLESEVASVPK